MSEIECPQRCKSCRTGRSSDGGMAVNSDGVCEYFCSIHAYCGNGTFYNTGDDCSGCKSGDFSLLLMKKVRLCFHVYLNVV